MECSTPPRSVGTTIIPPPPSFSSVPVSENELTSVSYNVLRIVKKHICSDARRRSKCIIAFVCFHRLPHLPPPRRLQINLPPLPSTRPLSSSNFPPLFYCAHHRSRIPYEVKHDVNCMRGQNCMQIVRLPEDVNASHPEAFPKARAKTRGFANRSRLAIGQGYPTACLRPRPVVPRKKTKILPRPRDTKASDRSPDYPSNFVRV